MKAIAAISDKKALAYALGQTLRADVDALNNTNFHTPHLFGLWVAPGFNDSEHYAAYLMQGGLQLPDREYYVADNEHMKEVRTKYQAHVSAMLKLAGFSDTDARAERIVALEHAIAEKHLTLAENDDIHKANNTWTQADFNTKAPGLDWAEYFRGAGSSKQASFIVWQPTAFAGESALVASTPLETWKDWLAYHTDRGIRRHSCRRLSPTSTMRSSAQTLQGTPQQRPRWQRGVVVVNRYLGDDVGKIYAQRYFPPEAKAQAQAMVANIIAAFRKRIDALSWMAASTKAEAQAKLTTLYVGIGYPETWIDYSAYEVKPDDIFGNVWRGKLFRISPRGRATGQADRPPRVVDDAADGQRRQPAVAECAELPRGDSAAAVLRSASSAAANYGAIGSIIGHEISHTFDTEGSAFDSKGRVRNWWTDADLAHFEAATAKLAAQYDTYQPFPDLHVNGKQTLAENIADVAGIAASYDGYIASLDGKIRCRRRMDSPAISSSSSPSDRTTRQRDAMRRCVSRSWWIRTRRRSIAPTRFATSTPGIRRSM